MALKREIVTDTSRHVRLAYVDRWAAKAWNQTRQPYDTQAFCGWFWITHRRFAGVEGTHAGKQEGGPFPTRSAAMRDAYYRFVRKTGTPALAFEVALVLDARVETVAIGSSA